MSDTYVANAEQEDSRIVAQILSTTSSDNYLSWRFRTIAKMNPYMASNPEALMSMASMPISNQELFTNSGAIYGMQQANDLAKKLPNYQPSVQRAIYSQLSAAQQSTLRSMGYTTPMADVHTEGFMSDLFGIALTPIRITQQGLGKALGPIVGPTLDFISDVSNVPFAAYRTIRSLDTPEQWIALAGAAAGLVAGIALAPVTAGASGTLAAASIASLSAIAGASATSLAASTLMNGSPSRWINAWNEAWNGERLFTDSANREAKRILENSDLVAFAQEIASDLDSDEDILDLAKNIAGVRDAQRQDVQISQLATLAKKYGDEGTPEFTAAYQALSELFKQPAFQEAVTTLAQGKISIGRDITRLIGAMPGFDLDPSEGVGRWLSGGIDAASMFFIDPLLFAGGLANKYKVAKYGLNFSDAGVADRFRQVAALPKVARKMDLIADAVRTGRVELLDRGAREYRAVYSELRAHLDNLRATEGVARGFTGNDVVEWIAGSSSMKSIMSGIGIVHGTNYGVVKGIGASQYYFRRASIPLREFLNGIDDVRLEGFIKKLIQNKEVGPALLDHLHGVSDDVVRELTPLVGDADVARVVARMKMNQPVQHIFDTGRDLVSFQDLFGRAANKADEFLSKLATDDVLAYNVGRIIGSIPIVRAPLRGFAQLVKGVTAALPGGAISFVGAGAVDDIGKFVDLFQGYMPSYVRTTWKQAIVNAPNPAARMQGSLALLDSLASAVGLRLTDDGNKLLDDFLYRYSTIYGQGPNARVAPYFAPGAQITAGTLPVQHMATMLPIPNLEEIRKAVQQGKIFEFLIGKNPHVLALQTRYWKPAVLLRLGFIFRNVSEEMLGFVTRYGVGSLSQEFTARGLAQKNLYEKASLSDEFAHSVRNTIDDVDSMPFALRKQINEVDQWIMRSRWDLPAVARPVARVLDSMGKSARPFVRVVHRYAEWLGDIYVRRAENLRAQFQAGFGSAEGLQKYLANIDGTEAALIGGSVDFKAARRNIQNWWRQLAFGNERSLRRMIIGGVDPKLVRHAEKFEGVFLKSIMEQVGTSNMAPWQRLRQGNYVDALVSTGRGEEVMLVQDLGVREFGTMDNPSPLTQPFTAGVQAVRQQMLDDPIAAMALQEFGLILNPEITATLDPENVKRVMVAFDDFLTRSDGKIDREVFQLYLTMTNGRFDRNKFDAILANMKIDLSKVVENYPLESVAYQWAAARNEFVDAIRAAFPSGKVPTWTEFMQLVRDPRKNPMLTARWSRYKDLEFLDSDAPGQFFEGIGFFKTGDQVRLFSAFEELLGDGLSVDARNWINRLMIQYYQDPSFLDMVKLRNWNPATGLSDSPFHASFLEAEPFIRERARLAYLQTAADPAYSETLQLNARWAGAVDSVPLYVIEPRQITDRLDEIDPLWRVSSLTGSNALAVRLGMVLPDGVEDAQSIANLHEQIRLMLANNRPLIFKNRESAQEVLQALASGTPNSVIKRGYVTRPPGSDVSDPAMLLARHLGVDNNVFSTQPLARISANAEEIDDFGMIAYQADDINADALSSFHFESINDLSEDARLDSIIEALVDHIRQNVLAGRRSQFYVRNDENARPLYRVIGNRTEQVTPGEIINANETFYSSPDAGPESVVKIGDQRFFFTDFPKYEGNNEVLWSIMNPIMFDHAEQNAKMALFQAKSPLAVTGGKADTGDADFIRIRYSSSDDVKRTSENDLPDYETLQVYKPLTENFWDKIVQFGFGRVIGPWIDALARKPIAFHAFALAADRNTANIGWLIRGSARQTNLRLVADDLVRTGVFEGPSGKFVDMYGELGRLVGRAHQDVNANTWSNLEAIGYLRGAVKDDPNLLPDLVRYWSERGSAYASETAKLSKTANNTLRAAAEDLNNNLGRLEMSLVDGGTDEVLASIDRVLGPNSALNGRASGFAEGARRLPRSAMTSEQRALDDALSRDYRISEKTTRTGWQIIQDAAEQRKAVDADVYKYAAEHAVRDLMPFIDSHEIRSQFADTVSGLLPFWYAEENFLKRWAKMFAEGGPALTLARVRKLQMTYLGLRTMGAIRTDPQGKDYFVWPGSEYMNEALQKAFGTDLPLNTVFQSPTDRIIPGFQAAFGAPATGPFVSLPLDFVGAIFPEAVPLERAVVGDFTMFRSVLDQIVPAQVKNTWQAIAAFSDEGLNGSNQRQASAMMTAMQQLEFTPYALKPDATPGEKDEYIRRVRDHARVILLSQAIGGWFMPAQISPLTTPNASSLSWFTEGAIDNPAEIFSKEYYELISNLGIEEGTIAFLELNADANLRSVTAPLAATVSRTATPSGAPLPTTEEGINFYLENRELLDQYPEAGPWMLPQDLAGVSKRSQYAYDNEIITGLRERRTPEEFLDALKYKEGAAVYFDSRRRYEVEYDRLKKAGNDEAATALTTKWNNWSTIWKITHPIFTEGLLSSEARQRRTRIIEQMRYLLNDPMAPKPAHYEALKTLMDTFDAFMIARGYLSLDQTAIGESKLAAAKIKFADWVSIFIAQNPAVQSFYQTVLSPEAGVD